MNKTYVGEGKVVLIAGGGKTYADIAANFCRTEKDLDAIIADEDTAKILRHLVKSGHKAALEFDDFIFGVEGYARVTEVQLVRKRHASYNIKSGRGNKNGNRSFDVVIPKQIENFDANCLLDINKASVKFSNDVNSDSDNGIIIPLAEIVNSYFPASENRVSRLTYDFNSDSILDIIENWYNYGVSEGFKEEELRYLKPQATEFKACIKMNAAGLRDWFQIRLCNRAQTEIRDLALKMYNLVNTATPALFSDVGPSCKMLGYCPEVEQCDQCKHKIPTKVEALKILKENYNPGLTKK